MAGHARYTVLLDACVLFPIAVCDALLSLAATGMFAAKWTTEIEEEWIRNLEAKYPHLKGRTAVRRDAMRAAVPDWEVPAEGWQALVPYLGLPDKDDRHVLAAAIAGHADAIVTVNTRHFPQDVVGRFGIEVLHPDDFIVAQLDLEQLTALKAFKDMRSRKKNPTLDPEEFAAAMERNGLAVTANRLRDAAGLI